jgi:DNA-binding transcriptional regulator YbjK
LTLDHGPEFTIDAFAGTQADDRSSVMTDSQTAPAVACDMTGAPDTPQQRLAEYARLFEAAFVSRERTAAGVRWRLRADPGVEAWARDLAARENACCAFMTNSVTVAGAQVLWDATTIDDPAARAVLAQFYDLPEG